MLKRLTALLLLLTLISSNLSLFMVYAGFEMNHKYIAENICINRDKPWLHCNGKCYFMRKVKQEQEKEKNEERTSQKNLFQDALFSQKAETKFYTRMLQEIQAPNLRIILPIVDH